MALRADIYNASDVLQATVNQVSSVKIVESLDKIGSADVGLPATDPGTQYLTAGAYLKLYDSEDGHLGTFLYEHHRLGEAAGRADLAVWCRDLLEELSRTSVHFWRNYDNQAVDTVISALVALASGWSDGDIETGIGNTTISYQGESVFIAIDALRDRWNKHFRQGTTDRTLDFGSFGDDSGVRLVRPETGIPPEMEGNASIAVVTSIELVEESEEIYNRVIPLGGGQGKAQITIEGSTVGDYTTETGTNADSSSFYYIEDSDSVTAYGRREKVLTFPQIRPIANNDTAIGRARDALKRAAEAYMARHLAPRVQYGVQVTGLVPGSVRVGDTVRLRYKGVVTQKGEAYRYIDVDADFYVMDIHTTRTAEGVVAVDLTISSIADRRTADSDVMIGVMHDLKAIKVDVQPAPANYKMGPFTRRMNSSNTGDFTLRVNTEVMEIISCRLYFKTAPLRSSVTASGAGSAHSHSLSISSSGAHTHSLDIGASGGHTHGLSISASGSHTHSLDVSASGAHTHDLDIETTGFHDHAVSIPAPEYLPKVEDTTGTDIAITGVATESQTHTHAGLTTASQTHTHTGLTTQSQTHTHPGLTTQSKSHTHEGQATDSESSHTHGLNYGLYEDSSYPTSISITIDGTDRTSALGGPWDTEGTGADVGPLDITDYLSTSPSIRQNHTLVFSCSSGQGEVECEADLLTVIQAIAVS